MQMCVNQACKIPRKCQQGQPCDVLKANLTKNLACAAARNAINNVCYSGGDPGHKQAAQDALNAAAKCKVLMALDPNCK